MKLIICEPGKRARERHFKEMPTLSEMQEIVGGQIEVVHPDGVPQGVVLVCNEEGKLLELPPNEWISIHGMEDLICGTFFFCAECKTDGELDLCLLTEKQAEAIMRRLTKAPTPKTCCLCGQPYEGEGNNAAPLSDGLCCYACNASLVIPERMKRLKKANGKKPAQNIQLLLSEALEEIAAEICEHICKYRDMATQEELDALCDDCPVGLLVG